MVAVFIISRSFINPSINIGQIHKVIQNPDKNILLIVHYTSPIYNWFCNAPRQKPKFNRFWLLSNRNKLSFCLHTIYYRTHIRTKEILENQKLISTNLLRKFRKFLIVCSFIVVTRNVALIFIKILLHARFKRSPFFNSRAVHWKELSMKVINAKPFKYEAGSSHII